MFREAGAVSGPRVPPVSDPVLALTQIPEIGPTQRLPDDVEAQAVSRDIDDCQARPVDRHAGTGLDVGGPALGQLQLDRPEFGAVDHIDDASAALDNACGRCGLAGQEGMRAGCAAVPQSQPP